MTTIPSETVLETRHYTDDLFSFRTTRPQSFRFRSGEFAMLGLPQENGKPLLRAYSIASPNWSDDLEFFSIKVPDGPLTSRLANVKPGDQILLRPKPTGTLVLDALLPGRTLWLVSTGTGIAPFASVARDPETYERFERVVLTHTCRKADELQYGIDVVDGIRRDPILSEIVGNRLSHIASVTRENAGPGTLEGRVTDLIRSGELFEASELPAWSPENDRVMICGSTAMIADTRALCEDAGLEEGSNSAPGRFVVEKAFVG
ncbi:ferredoxin--NADP reductase [Acuticoccus kandeliae]|uniref:ferredoxin--NADP reductase n=1 Tax=Acuticoccus kandeliae TaxID=2073160 RepID=UPI000D3E1C26|nr:ferredoxin--NADP reductase [Acuticoccus kandeliae]